ncbi:MAG: hypothetical protein VSS75_021785 [Candidatus Parabeggiatoa sp.]|nr:hypothetical protein [Candidatus Parabeggiatoa sp.]
MDEIEVLLNEIVEARKGIDAIFVSELKQGFLLDSSKTEKGRHPDLVKKLGGQAGAGGSAMTHMSVLQSFQRRISDFGDETGLGELKLTILQLGEKGDDVIKGTLVAYISHFKGMPIVIAFVNASPQDDNLGNIVFYCEQHIKNVRKLVGNKYG